MKHIKIILSILFCMTMPCKAIIINTNCDRVKYFFKDNDLIPILILRNTSDTTYYYDEWKKIKTLVLSNKTLNDSTEIDCVTKQILKGNILDISKSSRDSILNSIDYNTDGNKKKKIRKMLVSHKIYNTSYSFDYNHTYLHIPQKLKLNKIEIAYILLYFLRKGYVYRYSAERDYKFVSFRE